MYVEYSQPQFLLCSSPKRAAPSHYLISETFGVFHSWLNDRKFDNYIFSVKTVFQMRVRLGQIAFNVINLFSEIDNYMLSQFYMSSLLFMWTC